MREGALKELVESGGMDRRAFLKSFARVGAAALLGLVGMKAALGRTDGDGGTDPASECVRDGLCPRCVLLKKCGNPQALAYAEGKSREGP
jgi:hypothetical protein